MQMKRIARNVALQTLGYLIFGDTHVEIYEDKFGYYRRENLIYKGVFRYFDVSDVGMRNYSHCIVTRLNADENILYIGIEI